MDIKGIFLFKHTYINHRRIANQFRNKNKQ